MTTTTVVPFPSRQDRARIVAERGTQAVLILTGCSFRQIDYWTRSGRLHAIDNAPGSGRNRIYTDTEIAVARNVRRLLDVGFDLDAAFAVARETPVVENWHQLGPGIALVFTDPTDDDAEGA